MLKKRREASQSKKKKYGNIANLKQYEYSGSGNLNKRLSLIEEKVNLVSTSKFRK